METRHIDGGRELLDRQLVDRDGRLCGNVDDVELSDPEPGELPVVTALLSASGYLAERIGGRVAHGWATLRRRLQPSGDTGAIPMRHVADIGSAVHLALSREELASDELERWVRDHVIGRLPGARHAPE